TLADTEDLAYMRWSFDLEDANDTTVLQEVAGFAEAFAEFLQSALASGRWTVWVAEMNGRLLAHMYVQFVDKVPRPGRLAARWGYVTNVYVEPTSRNRGIGSRLLRQVIDWARNERLQMLILWPSDRSLTFYERAGCVRSPDALELHLDS
ncbi:MAG TPA: GNAT family N-acetyltransferase, partial [Chloroflexota bacterium]|nr:GNAT family N-acetyltransferase [Chloroflexota bacterium]